MDRPQQRQAPGLRAEQVSGPLSPAHPPRPLQRRRTSLATSLAALLATWATAAAAQAPPATEPGLGSGAADPGWARCTTLTQNKHARLACFDRWARQQQAGPAPAALAAATTSSLPSSALTPGPRPTAPATGPAERTPGLALNLDTRPAPTTTGQGPGPAQPLAAAPAVATLAAGTSDPGCKDTRYTTLSRFWELEPGSDCGTFGIRGYRPISLSLIASDSVNTAPASPSPEHTASFSPYRRTETRIQLSVRTKLAQGLLTRDHPTRHDSLWFGYSQQSYWQLFTGALSRPFRNTDHEPELVYVYPTDTALPRGWRWRYAGLGVVHQSNGQTLPLSRSWNRVYLMGGVERDDRWRLTGRVWQRLPEKAATDDNPDISDTVGRAELMAAWHPNPDHTLSLTLRHSLRATARGSLRLEWLRALGDGGPAQQSGLRFHTQLFSGYGDSLVDYNRRRTVLSVGLSLVDF